MPKRSYPDFEDVFGDEPDAVAKGAATLAIEHLLHHSEEVAGARQPSPA